jgi:hypothetical protein
MGQDTQAPLQPSDIHAIVEQYIADRSIGWPMPYFAPPDDALVPYVAYRKMHDWIWRDLDALQRRITELEQPWWKRLFKGRNNR